MKKKLSMLLAIILCITTLYTPAMTASAKTKLNKSSVKLAIDTSFQLKVKGTKKKVTWRSSKPAIASVSYNGKVTAKKTGTTKITATVKKKSYVCKVTVSTSKSTTKASNNKYLDQLTYDFQQTSTGVIVTLYNGNAQNICIDNANLAYYDEYGALIDTISDNGNNACVEANSYITLYFAAPRSIHDDLLNYSSYNLKLNVKKSEHQSYCSKITTTKTLSNQQLTVTAINNSGVSINTTVFTVVFYDANRKAIGWDSKSISNFEAGSSNSLNFSFPENEKNERLTPASYEVFINGAYTH